MKDRSRKTKSAGIDMAFLMGFSDELQKIANWSSAQASSPADVMKAVPKAAKSSLTSRPKPISKPQPIVAEVPKDPLLSTRTMTPPPITGSNS